MKLRQARKIIDTNSVWRHPDWGLFAFHGGRQRRGTVKRAMQRVRHLYKSAHLA